MMKTIYNPGPRDGRYQVGPEHVRPKGWVRNMMIAIVIVVCVGILIDLSLL